MKFVDPHIHMTSRTTDDYEAMARSGIRVVVEPAFWLGQPRTHAGSFEDYFLSLIGWERFRARQFGIQHFCTIALNPKECNDPRVADAVIEMMPRYLEKDGVVAVGEIGLDEQTDTEHRFLRKQIDLARSFELPILIHTPHRDKVRGTQVCLDVVREMNFPPELTLIDHNNEETIEETLASGCWAGHSIYPDTKMDEARMVSLIQRYGPDRMIVNSAADWGVSDPLKVPKTAAALSAAGVSDSVVEQVCWHNPIKFFAQSGRLTLNDEQSVDQRELFEGNSVLRGQTPRVPE